jgi:hypothetical protein
MNRKNVMGLDQDPGQQQITIPHQLRYVVNLFPESLRLIFLLLGVRLESNLEPSTI